MLYPIEMFTNKTSFPEQIGGGLCPPEPPPDKHDPGAPLIRSEGGTWGAVRGPPRAPKAR